METAPSYTCQEKQPKMIEVESSQIEMLGYDAATMVCHIKFKRGGLYRYRGVTQEAFDALIGDGQEDHSIGSHWIRNCRKSWTDYERLTDDGQPDAEANQPTAKQRKYIETLEANAVKHYVYQEPETRAEAGAYIEYLKTVQEP